MNKLLKLLFYLCLFSIILGPMGVLPLEIAGVNVYLTDIFVGSLVLVWIVNWSKLMHFVKKDAVARSFFPFVVVALVSLVFSPIHLSMVEKFISSLYLLRFVSYFFVYVTVVYLLEKKRLTQSSIFNWLGVIGIVLAFIGWMQYFLYPDLRNLYYLGWDPHYKRIFSTYFDPNYFGLVMVLTLVVNFFFPKLFRVKFCTFRNLVPQVFGHSQQSPGRSRFEMHQTVRLFATPSRWPNGLLEGEPELLRVQNYSSIVIWISRLFLFITILFTYSRSSYFALLSTAFYYAWMKKKVWIIGTTLLVLVVSAVFLPRPGGEGVKLERVFSIEQRIENWKAGFKIFLDHPILGVGFNTVRFAKREQDFPREDWLTTHSGAGFENSFLFVLTTTGMLGLISYLLLLGQIFKSGNLITKTFLIAIITHSLFLNSLFFPWVMLWMWVVVGIGKE